MWLCKENIAKIAEQLDCHKTLKELNIDEIAVMEMAYQLQYFFEAMEKIKDVQALEILNDALIEKEE